MSIKKEYKKAVKSNKKLIKKWNILVDDYYELADHVKKHKKDLTKYYEEKFEEFRDQFTDDFSHFVDVIEQELKRRKIRNGK